MTTNRTQAEASIFEAIMAATDPYQRQAILDSACGDDQELRNRVMELLDAVEEADDFLQQPAAEFQVETIEPLSIEEPGSIIGRYKLLEHIGEGGFGAVYMADQLRPFERRVALKIIKLGMDTKQVIARFEAERQALALMDHPNIAKILDAGTTETGRPYFVMELVRGIPVTEFCDDRSLGTKERLRLFIQICDAVQHAHQKGIIHRDIKPTNILVSTNGDAAVPKVIDFGIAKATQGKLTDKTLFTQFRQFIGTPAYMSPEQAQMSAVDVDTRSDIYSLGVLLYELLTGKTPLDTKSLVSAGYEEICRRIREEEAPKPSKRLSSLHLDELTTLAKNRNVPPSQFTTSVQGDVDWIVMKAVEKDRSQRYESCGALAADIEHYLKDEPVTAGRPSAFYYLRKFIKRNRAAAITTVAIALSLLLGTIVASFGWLQALDAKHETDVALGKLSQQVRQTQNALNVAKQETRRATVAEGHAKSSQESAETARKRAISTAYVADMSAAHQALRLQNLGRAKRILARTKNFPADHDPRNWEWRALWLLCQGEAEKQFGVPGKTVGSLELIADAALVVSGGDSVRIWDMDSGQIKRTLTDETDGKNFVVEVSNDGNRIYVGDSHGRVRMWDVRTFQELPTNISVGRRIRNLKASPDGKWLVTLSHGKSGVQDAVEIIVWDLESGARRSEFPEGDGGGQGTLDISRDSSMLVIGLHHELRIIALDSLKEIRVIQRERAGRNAVAFSPDGQFVACATGLTVPDFFVHRVADGEQVAHLTGHLHATKALAYSPDGRLIASASADRTVRLWDTSTYKEVATLIGHENSVYDLAFSKDSKTLVSCDKNARICVWSTKTDTPSRWPVTREYACYYGSWCRQMSQVSYSPDGSEVATTVYGWDDTVQGVTLRSSKTLEANRTVHKTDVKKRGVRFSPVSELLAIGDFGGKLSFVNTAETSNLTEVLISEGAEVFPCRFSRDGERLVVVARLESTTSCHVLSVGDRTLLSSWDLPPNDNCCVISPAGDLVATGHEDGIRIWKLPDPETPQLIPIQGVLGIDISPDGKTLVASRFSSVIEIINLETLQPIDSLVGHNQNVGAVRFSPDGKRIASAGSGRLDALKLWDFETRREILTLMIDGWSNRQIEWSPDGNSILMMGGGSRVSIWRVPSFEEIAMQEKLKDDQR